MLSVPSIVPEAFLFGVALALVFGIFVGWARLHDWTAKLAHKKRRK
jgi:hypothetical protein